jgi:peptidoglycan/LPS O-acetylase OafA/YrhL
MRDNNFDTIRLLAALSVLVSHAFPLSYGRAAWQPLQLLTRQQTNLGLTAVFVFFIISGWLITESFSRNSPGQYAIARALRILPGLTAVLLALVFLIGPALTTVPLRDYFGSAQAYSFLSTNLSLTSFVDGLPGVFDSNPFPHAVNGSLWTLRYEAECYGIVYILGRCGLLHRYVMTALLFACLLASWRYIGGWRLEFYSCFAAGAALCVWSRHYPHRQLLQGRFALIATLVWAASFYMGFRVASATFGAYVVLYLGLAPTIRLPKVKRWGDLSYGTYVWAWPIQQTVTLALGAWASWWLNITLSLPLTLAIAALSWRYIEWPALALKRPRLSSDRVVVPQGGGGL